MVRCFQASLTAIAIRRGAERAGESAQRHSVFIDYSQAGVYDNTRIAAHETGHVLGLPDHYQGPCSELMSGGGPGPSCTNSYPNATESAQVNNLWAFGLLSNAGLMKRIDEKIPTAAH